VLGVLVVTGALVTAAGPHSGGVGIRRFGSFEEAVDAHVAATGVFGIGFLVLAAWLYRLRRSVRPEFLLAAGVLALLLAQAAVGETQYRSGLPWWLVLVHVTLATATFGAMFALAWRLVCRIRRA
jgi:cytochrome c oxidase assembly protein subunit 15